MYRNLDSSVYNKYKSEKPRFLHKYQMLLHTVGMNWLQVLFLMSWKLFLLETKMCYNMIGAIYIQY